MIEQPAHIMLTQEEAAEARELARRLEAAFTIVERERMTGIPILNPKLRVASTAIRACGGVWVCALVTPWFINLMLLPKTSEAAQDFQRAVLGAKAVHELPAGAFEFICGADEGIGAYRMCSLFSPVLQFENQEAAFAAAEAALAALFDKDLDATIEREAQQTLPKKDAPQLSRRNLFTLKAARP